MSYELVTLEKTDLAQNIAHRLGKELRMATLRQFADGELNVHLNEYHLYAGKTVVIIQSTGGKVNEYTLGVAFLAQTLKQAGAKKIIAVVPYLGYARQDRGIVGNPGHVQVVIELFETSGIDMMITVDIHAKEVLRLFSIPITNILVQDTIVDCITKQFPHMQNICLVAPDEGAHEYVKEIAAQLGVGTIICTKERFATDQTRLLNCVIDCEGTVGVIVDDIVSTGGTVAHVTHLLLAKGYHDVFGYIVHPVLAGNAVERIQKAGMHTLFVSNSLPLSPEVEAVPFVVVFDISKDIVPVLKEKLYEI